MMDNKTEKLVTNGNNFHDETENVTASKQTNVPEAFKNSEYGVHLLSVFYDDGRLAYVCSSTLADAPLKAREEVATELRFFIDEKILRNNPSKN